MWRTETARLLSVNRNTSSGLDSSPWVLDGWAEIQQWQTQTHTDTHTHTLHFHCGEIITKCNRGLSVCGFLKSQTLDADFTDERLQPQIKI